MTDLEIVSACCLSVVALLCGLAIFCRNYHENWLQFVGLVGMCIWAVARTLQFTDMTDARIPGRGLILYVSMACYAIGTAWKVWQHRGGVAPPAPPAPYKLEPRDMRQVAGGSNQ